MVSTRSSSLLESSSSEEYEDAIQPDDIEGEIVFASKNSEPGDSQQQQQEDTTDEEEDEEEDEDANGQGIMNDPQAFVQAVMAIKNCTVSVITTPFNPDNELYNATSSINRET